jgi:hypothetical protein
MQVNACHGGEFRSIIHIDSIRCEVKDGSAAV